MKILHLEDHLLFAEGFGVLLQQLRSDLSIISASTTEHALALLERHGDIDLVIVDLHMPGLNGQTFIEALNQRNLYIPFIVLSASEDLEKIAIAINAGASGFIPKTYGADQILQVIDEVMAGGTVIPEDIVQGIKKFKNDLINDKAMRAYQLSSRQMDVLKLMHQGHSNQDIAAVLDISVNTVKVHVRTLFECFDVGNRTDCVFYAQRHGLLMD